MDTKKPSYRLFTYNKYEHELNINEYPHLRNALSKPLHTTNIYIYIDIEDGAPQLSTINHRIQPEK